MSEQTQRRGMTLEENQPDYDDPSKQPKTLTRSRHIDGVYYVAGRAPKEQEEYEVMLITVSVEEEEATTHATSTFGFRVPQPAEYLKGANGVIKDVALMSGIDMDKCYYTAVCKWLLPRAQRARPSKKIMKWGMKILDDEIARVKPKIIVCLGKPVFDLVGDQKVNFKDAHGCWFWNEQYQAHMYVMHAPYTLVGNPEHYETFRIDFKEIARRRDILRDGGKITGADVTYQVIDNEGDLLEWLDRIEELAAGPDWPGLRDEEGNPILSVDCEWHGKTHVDGQLRTIQFAWSETEAVVIAFRNEENVFSFHHDEPLLGACWSKGPDGDYRIDHQVGEYFGETDLKKGVQRAHYARTGRPIAATLERVNARFIGHHFAADAPWMQHWLGIETYEKCVLDTEFAQQTVDESSELGLERGIAMKYTNLGRYDQALVEWKRENKELVKGGYGYVPSSILYPYGAKDVCTPYRAYPLIKRQLEAQRLWDYYKTIANPYCTDVFTEFAMVGLPMDIPMMDDLRNLFTWTTDRLNKKLQERIATEAVQKFKSRVMQEFGVSAVRELWSAIDARDEEVLKESVKNLLGDRGQMKDVPKWNKMIHHLVGSPRFNIRSPDQMALWLFDFEGLMPVKSTNQKAKGLPSMAWEKVLELPADRQALYKPAVDKQTMSILADQLPALDELLNLNAVGNLSKAFLNEPDVYIDGDTGEEVVEEHGLHAWLCGDSRIHCQYSTTDTYRSRCLPGDANVLVRNLGRGDVVELPLKDVDADYEVWDGEEWVMHSGVVEQGVQRVYEYQGLWATLNHEVWVYNDSCSETYAGGDIEVPVTKTLFGIAIRRGDDLVRGRHGLRVSALDRYDLYPLPESAGVDPNSLPSRVVMTYDLLNAGPRRRFTCNGFLVSNSWQPNTLNYPSFVNKRIAKTVERCIREAHEEGDLPENLTRWIGVPGDQLPSIRSCIAAPEGMVLVESDYATAEMVALAMISGDKDLQRLLRDPDPEWAKLKPGHWTGASVVRVAFSDSKLTGVPESVRNPEFLMKVWEAGECLGSAYEEDLLRDADGNVVHAKYDIHWSLIERTYERYREMMKSKVDRNAAKVLNFCLCGNSKVLTRDRGPVAIRDIRLDDWLWDGVEWIQHEGVIYTGRKEVIEYQGLRATRLHDVWTVERGKVKLEEACAESLTLVRSGDTCPGAADPWLDDLSEDGGAAGIGLLLRADEVRSLSSGEVEGTPEYGEGAVLQMPVSALGSQSNEVCGQGSKGDLLARPQICSHAPALLHGHACVLSPLHGEGHTGGVQGQGGLHSVGAGELHGRADSGERLRQEGQRRELLQGEPEARRPEHESNESGVRDQTELSGSQAVSQGPSGGSLHVEDCSRAHEDGTRGRRDLDAACAEFSRGEAETYDILNAGPRHRFTCSGVLVSNSSAYGASATSLERKIESDTGVKPTEGTGERGLEAISERQPRATQFLEEMARVPKEKGFYRAASGRIRHCPMHGAGSGVGWRTRNSIESALGRQMRNYPFQESVGATAARACKWLMNSYRRLGLKARIMTCLYDSVVTLCPLEERFVVARLHKICMSEINTWDYTDEPGGPRTLQYSIDNEFNWRWSTRPSKEEQKALSDPAFHPPTKRLEFLADHPQLSLLAGLPPHPTIL